ncbi:MAG: hypothetical protein IPN50_10230 [Sphingomonadales bacterium]|nr:hypothetical protein [Sphingomonadales bacterium]
MTKLRKSALLGGLTAMLLSTPLPALAAPSFGGHGATIKGAPVLSGTAEGRRRHWGHRDRIDGGDILAGIGILAGIAIIAGAASESNKRDREVEPRYRDYDNGPAPAPAYGGNDVGTAVSSCTDAAERSSNGRVDEIRSVTREGNSWRVDGEIGNDAFTCSATNGRVDYIRINGRDI